MALNRSEIKARGATFVRFYPSYWRSGCIGLSLEQEGFLRRVCLYAIGERRNVPCDDREVARVLGTHLTTYRRIRDQLLELGKIELSDGGYVATTSAFGPDASGRLEWALWAELRKRIFERDKFACRYCGAVGIALECDHVFPVSLGGSNDEDNLVTACKPCNRSKRDKVVSIEEWSAKRRAAS